MSVTIIQTPEQYTPGYNEQVFLASGTTSGKFNYKYIFNIYDSTGTTKLVPSIKVPPRPSDSWAVFDAGRIVEAYLASDIAILSNGQEGFKTNDNSYYAYKVKVGEEFDASTTGVTSYPDQVTTSGVVFAWNAAYSFQDFKDYNPTDRISGGATRKLLTTAPVTLAGAYYEKISSDENAWLYAISSISGDITLAQIQTYNTASVLQGTYLVTNNFAAYTTEYQRKFLRFPSGTRNINRIASADISVVLGTTPIITPSIAWYTIKFLNGATTQKTQQVVYIVDDIAYGASIVHPFILQGCTKYDSYRLHFLNNLGGFDSFTFNKVSRINEDIERKSYKKIYGSTSGRWSYNNYDRGVVNYNTSIKDKLTLNSDWITEAEATWLEQLIASPEIYWDNNDELWAVNITNSSYEKKKVVNDKVFNLTVEIEISQKRFTQRG